MASIITATTTSGLTQSADNSGVLQLASGVGNLVTVPAVTGTAMVSGNMPAFSARQSSAQTVATSADVTVIFDSEDFDTNSCYNNTGSTVGGIPAYSFRPNVAGYYQVNSAIRINMTVASYFGLSLFKNGSVFNASLITYSSVNTFTGLTHSSLVYLNGTTDYISMALAQFTGSSQVMVSASPQVYFQAAMVRSA
jgi:hypothetical protein